MLCTVSASRATEPLASTMSSCKTAVAPRAMRLILTARMPWSLDSRAESTESAESWLWGRNRPVSHPQAPWPWSWWSCSCPWWSWWWSCISSVLCVGVQLHQLRVDEVVARNLWSVVLGVVDGVGDQLSDVFVLESVEDLCALAAGLDQAGHAQLGQVLRHRGGQLADFAGQLVNRKLPADQRPQDSHPGGISEHAEHLDGQIDLIVGERTPIELVIRTDTQIIERFGARIHRRCEPSPAPGNSDHDHVDSQRRDGRQRAGLCEAAEVGRCTEVGVGGEDDVGEHGREPVVGGEAVQV